MSPKVSYTILLISLVVFSVATNFTYAKVNTGDCGQTLKPSLFDDIDKLGKTGTRCIEDVVINITTFVQTLGIALVVVFIIWGSFQLMTSGGEPGKITAGQNTLRWSIIGLGVILLAQGLVSAILETLKARREYIPSDQQQTQNASPEAPQQPSVSLVAENTIPIFEENVAQELYESLNCNDQSANIATLCKDIRKSLAISGKATSLIGTKTPEVCSATGNRVGDPGVRCALFTGIAINPAAGTKLTEFAPENWANPAGTRYSPKKGDSTVAFLTKLPPGAQLFFTNNASGNGVAAFDGDPPVQTADKQTILRSDRSHFYHRGDHVPVHVAIYQPQVTITRQQAQTITQHMRDQGRPITLPRANSDGSVTIKNAMVHNQSGVVVVESVEAYMQRSGQSGIESGGRNLMGAKVY